MERLENNNNNKVDPTCLLQVFGNRLCLYNVRYLFLFGMAKLFTECKNASSKQEENI